MTIERALDIPATSLNGKDSQQLLLAYPRLGEKIDFGNVKYGKALEYVTGQDDEKTRQHNALSVFRAGMPGVLSLQEVKNSINLGLWNLALGDRVVRLEVNKLTPTMRLY